MPITDNDMDKIIGTESRDISRDGTRTAESLSVIIPCCNEQESLGLVAESIQRFSEHAGNGRTLRFLLVDDASSDRTFELLTLLFGDRPDTTILRHEANRGVAAAIETGCRNAGTDLVASIDADCTYDLLELSNMIEYLTPGVDMVVASPYHPNGAVVGVGRFRFFLSRSLSRLYRIVLHNRLYTYTSCFRVARTPTVNHLKIDHGGFLGITELLARLDMSGGVIREYPTVLHTRQFGTSKMKILRTIAGHLGLLARAVGWNLKALAAGLQPPSRAQRNKRVVP